MNENPRKVFISYSWVVQARVVELAERLVATVLMSFLMCGI